MQLSSPFRAFLCSKKKRVCSCIDLSLVVGSKPRRITEKENTEKGEHCDSDAIDYIEKMQLKTGWLAIEGSHLEARLNEMRRNYVDAWTFGSRGGQPEQARSRDTSSSSEEDEHGKSSRTAGGAVGDATSLEMHPSRRRRRERQQVS
jgi:hypothetical protein